jgi:hypothetical protein
MFAHCLRMVCAMFARCLCCLCKVYAMFAQRLLNVCATFVQRLRGRGFATRERKHCANTLAQCLRSDCAEGNLLMNPEHYRVIGRLFEDSPSDNCHLNVHPCVSASSVRRPSDTVAMVGRGAGARGARGLDKLLPGRGRWVQPESLHIV